jgi:predicted AAA+ superfamily ATPase
VQSKISLDNNFESTLARIQLDKSSVYLSCLTNFSRPFKTRHVFIPFGTDFSFEHADSNYKYLEKLIDWVNSHTNEGEIGSKFRFRMSSVDEYF